MPSLFSESISHRRWTLAGEKSRIHGLMLKIVGLVQSPGCSWTRWIRTQTRRLRRAALWGKWIRA